MKKLIAFLEPKVISWESPLLGYIVAKLIRFDRWIEDKYFEFEQRMYGIQSDAYLLEEMRKRTKKLVPRESMSVLVPASVIDKFKELDQRHAETMERENIKSFVDQTAKDTPRPKSQKAPKKKVAKKKTPAKRKPRRSNNK